MRRAIGLLALANLCWLSGMVGCAAECSPAQGARQVREQVREQRNTRPKSQSNQQAQGAVVLTTTTKKSAPPVATWVGKGKLQPSREAATEEALKAGDDQLIKFLRTIRPSTNWPQHVVRSYVLRMRDGSKDVLLLLDENGREQLKRDFDIEPPSTAELQSEFGERQVWIAKVELNLTKELNNELVYKLRMDEAKGRQWLMAKVFMGALALLGTLGLYYRFDERTKGYYTNWLRVGALCTLVLAAYGIVRLP